MVVVESVEQLQDAWRADRKAREEELAGCEADRDRYRAALGRIARSDPGSYFGILAAEALRDPSPELASLEEWGASGLGT